MTAASENTSSTRLIPLTEWQNYHPEGPPLGTLRDLVFRRIEIGADAWIRRIGRRIYVDERAWYAWVSAGAGGQGAKPIPRPGPRRDAGGTERG